jgi:hypothetical protein
VAPDQRQADLPNHPEQLPGTIETKIRPALGTLPINRVDARTLDRFYGQLRTRGNARQDRWKDGKAKDERRPAQRQPNPRRARHHLGRPRARGTLGLAAAQPGSPGEPPAARNAKRPVPTMGELGELLAAVADDPEV